MLVYRVCLQRMISSCLFISVCFHLCAHLACDYHFNESNISSDLEALLYESTCWIESLSVLMYLKWSELTHWSAVMFIKLESGHGHIVMILALRTFECLRVRQ